MKITLNGKPFVCDASVTNLYGLLSSLELNAEQVVVEHNGSAISREKLESSVLTESDTVEIIHFVGGG